MLLARRNNDSNWLSNWFEDNFFDTDLMPRMNVATAPATNINFSQIRLLMTFRKSGE